MTKARAKRAGNPYVARIFFLWGMLLFGVLLVGLALALVEGSARAQFLLPGPAELVSELSRFSARGVLALGLFLALALPLVRNLGVMFVMVRRREWRAALLAGAVFLALLALYAFVWAEDLLASPA